MEEVVKSGQCMSTWDTGFICGSLLDDLKSFYPMPGHCRFLLCPAVAHFIFLIIYLLFSVVIICENIAFSLSFGLSWMMQISGMLALYYLTFVLHDLVLTSPPWSSLGGHHLLWTCRENVWEKVCLVLSLGRGKDTVSLAQLYPTAWAHVCLTGSALSFFISVYL